MLFVSEQFYGYKLPVVMSGADYEYSLVPTMDLDEMYSDRNKHQPMPWEDNM